MRLRLALGTLLLALPLVDATAWAAVPESEAATLRQVAQAYQGLRRYYFHGTVRITLASGGQLRNESVAPFVIAADGAGRFRDQADHAELGGIVVSDGARTWIYNGRLGQYVERAGRADTALAGSPAQGLGSAILARYRGLDSLAVGAVRLPDDAIRVAGITRTCAVLEVTFPPTQSDPRIQELPSLLWIDPHTHFVVRQRSIVRASGLPSGSTLEQHETITVDRALVDPPLPDSLWAFRAPAGAKKVGDFDESASTAGGGMAGKPAADFVLKDLAGKTHTLKGLRGKVVLLDFWATWCGPCRMTMPRVAKIHEEFRNKGVEVLSVNISEPAQRARDYLTKNGYVFTTLLDTDGSVAMKYRAQAIPTLVVIDKSGTISSYLVGVREEAELRSALRKAGVR